MPALYVAWLQVRQLAAFAAAVERRSHIAAAAVCGLSRFRCSGGRWAAMTGSWMSGGPVGPVARTVWPSWATEPTCEMTVDGGETDSALNAPDSGSLGDREWTTRSREIARRDDLVALSLLEHPDAIGQVLGEADDGQVSCMLVHCKSCRPGRLVVVQEDQLLVLMRRGGGSRKMSFDYETGVWPKATPVGEPSTETEPKAETTGGEGQSAA